jgi:dTDP-4-amino-4,6-dideoxygalactose transaminase
VNVQSELNIKVLEPRLPTVDAIAPYLREIDSTRWYTNFGPLVRRFEQRLAEHFGIPDGGVVAVANGTLGLTLALRALECQPGGFCLVPSWSFVATAHAVLAAGLTPYFIDVDPDTWAITPDCVRNALRDVAGPVVAVIPVAPFGASLDSEAWDAFGEETAIKVVADAAASFDSARPMRVPTMISLHATKVFGVGEGGVVVSTDLEVIDAIRALSNFGFAGTRESKVPAFNAKLSEYAAAVGLAALDVWPETRISFAALTASYTEMLAATSGIRPAPGFGDGTVSSTCNVELGNGSADAVGALLADHGIGTRQWWGAGCHSQAAFAACPHGELSVTDHLANTVLGLPFHLGVGAQDVKRLSEMLQVARL